MSDSGDRVLDPTPRRRNSKHEPPDMSGDSDRGTSEETERREDEEEVERLGREVEELKTVMEERLRGDVNKPKMKMELERLRRLNTLRPDMSGDSDSGTGSEVETGWCSEKDEVDWVLHDMLGLELEKLSTKEEEEKVRREERLRRKREEEKQRENSEEETERRKEEKEPERLRREVEERLRKVKEERLKRVEEEKKLKKEVEQLQKEKEELKREKEEEKKLKEVQQLMREKEEELKREGWWCNIL